MAREYITAIIGGKVPCVESTIQSTCIIVNDKAVEEAVQVYTGNMNARLELPTADSQTLSDMHSACFNVAIATFHDRAVMDEDKHYQNMTDVRIYEKYKEFKKENETKSAKKCLDVLQNLHRQIGDKIHNTYTVTGGYAVYRDDFAELTETYKRTDGLGICKETVLLEFIESKYTEAEAIRNADKSISAAEKATEIERIKAEEAEIREALARDEAKSREEELRTRTKQMEDNIAQQRAHYEKVMADRMREMEQCIKEGNEKAAEQLKDEIKDLHKRLEEVMMKEHVHVTEVVLCTIS